MFAAAGGIAVANLYYVQPLLAVIAQDFHASASSVGIVSVMAQAGYAIGIVAFVPLGDVLQPRRLLASVFLVVAVMLAGTASAPSVTVRAAREHPAAGGALPFAPGGDGDGAAVVRGVRRNLDRAGVSDERLGFGSDAVGGIGALSVLSAFGARRFGALADRHGTPFTATLGWLGLMATFVVYATAGRTVWGLLAAPPCCRSERR